MELHDGVSYVRVPEKPSFADQATKSSLIVRKNKH
jgi:hypothetical protein